MPRIEFTGEIDFRGRLRRQFPRPVRKAQVAAERVMRSGFGQVAQGAAQAAPRRTGALSRNVFWGKVEVGAGILRYHCTLARFYASFTNDHSGWFRSYEESLRQVTFASGVVAQSEVIAGIAPELLNEFGRILSPPFKVEGRVTRF